MSEGLIKEEQDVLRSIGVFPAEEQLRVAIEYSKALEGFAFDQVKSVGPLDLLALPFGSVFLNQAKSFDLGPLASLCAFSKQAEAMKTFEFLYSCIHCRWLSGDIDSDSSISALKALIEVFEKSSGFDKKYIAPTIFRVHRIYAEQMLNPDHPSEPEVAPPITPMSEPECEMYAVSAQGDSDEREVVYFVQNPSSKKIKIGYSTGFKARLRALECGAGEALDVLLLLDGNRDLEASLHAKFSEFRLRGEWFRPCPEILEFVQKQSA